jgi:hypothetical protein
VLKVVEYPIAERVMGDQALLLNSSLTCKFRAIKKNERVAEKNFYLSITS